MWIARSLNFKLLFTRSTWAANFGWNYIIYFMIKIAFALVRLVGSGSRFWFIGITKWFWWSKMHFMVLDLHFCLVLAHRLFKLLLLVFKKKNLLIFFFILWMFLYITNLFLLCQIWPIYFCPLTNVCLNFSLASSRTAYIYARHEQKALRFSLCAYYILCEFHYYIYVYSL